MSGQVLSGIKIGAVNLPRRFRPVYLLLIILIAGATLRFWTIGAGAPYEIGVDEPVIMDTAVRMIKTGDFNITFYDYGGFTYYLQAAVASARFLVGAMNREWTSLQDVWEGDFYVWARAMTALLGTLTIVLVYRAGLRLGTAAALFAALAMALQPQHVRESHFALTDVPMTFFVVLTLVQSLSASQNPRPIEFLLAGIATGLAAATKYNAALAIVMPLCALSPIKAIRLFVASAAALLAGAAIGFVVGAPYTLLDLPGFLNGFARLLGFYNERAPVGGGRRRLLEPHRPVVRLARHRAVARRRRAGAAHVLLRRVGHRVGSARRREARARAAPARLPDRLFLVHRRPVAPVRAVRPAARAVPVSLVRRRRRARGVVPLGARRAAEAGVDGGRPRRAHADAGARRVDRIQHPPAHPEHQRACGALARRRRSSRGEAVAIESRAYLQVPPMQIRTVRVNRLIQETLEVYRAKGVVYLVASSGEYEGFLSNPNRDPVKAAAYIDLFRSTETVQVFTSANTNLWPTIRILRIN